MRIFKNKAFHKWAAKERISDRGKSSGVRTLLAYRVRDKVFFIFGFSKNARENISIDELAALKRLAKEMLEYSDRVLESLVLKGELVEVQNDGQ